MEGPLHGRWLAGSRPSSTPATPRRRWNRALRSLGWVDELIVVDMESRDATPAIARRRGARVLPAPMAPRVDGIRDTYVALASHDWIIVLDSDEHLADEAHDRIPAILARHGREYDAFAIPRFNSIAGQLMRGSGWAPESSDSAVSEGYRQLVGHNAPAAPA